MQPLQYKQLVALPFNAAACRERQHKNCPTFGIERQHLWRQVVEMMHENYANWGGGDRDSSNFHFLRARFILDDWSLERIASNRDRFLSFETKNKISCNPSDRINRGFLIIDAEKGKLLGERRTGHQQHDPQTASGIDIVRPSERGKGLSRDFFELGCLVAKELGYKTYRAGISNTLPQSYKRLERMVEEGRAEKLPTDWDGARRYSIDLKKFSARCD